MSAHWLASGVGRRWSVRPESAERVVGFWRLGHNHMGIRAAETKGTDPANALAIHPR